MQMTGRKYQVGSTSYRYSINGQEKESELNESITNAKYWEYDSRIGRRWNLDPIFNTDVSRYSIVSNNPIYYSDPLGDFKTKLGAFLYSIIHGGKVNRQAENTGKHSGEWRVSKTVEYKGKEAGVAVNVVYDWKKSVESGPPAGGRPTNPFGITPSKVFEKIDDLAGHLQKKAEEVKNRIRYSASQIWYSPLARGIIPDYYTFSGSFQTSSGIYTNEEITLTLMLRGKDPGLYFNSTTGFGGVSSIGVDVGCSVGKGYYLGDARNLSSSVLGGWQGSGSVGVGLKALAGASVNGGVDVGFNDGKATTVTGKVGISVGVGVSTPVIQGSGGGGFATPAIRLIKF